MFLYLIERINNKIDCCVCSVYKY